MATGVQFRASYLSLTAGASREQARATLFIFLLRRGHFRRRRYVWRMPSPNMHAYAKRNEGFGSVLRRHRVAAGLSQQALAERANLSVQAVASLENRRRNAPYRDTIERLAMALQLSANVTEELFLAAQRNGHRGSSKNSRRIQPTNLPRHFASFVGREDAIADIQNLLSDAPLVSIAGAGGIGKTSLAVHAGARELQNWKDGVWFVQLGRISDPRLASNAIGEALGVHEAGNRRSSDDVIAYLKTKRALLVLDNCEHMIGEVRRVVRGILQECWNLAILATTREPLGIPGERVYRLPPLAFPPTSVASAEEAANYAAVTLFVERACAAEGGFDLQESNVAAIAQICRRVDGIPLAIELAAAKIRVLSPRQLADQLKQRLAELRNTDPCAVPRHQTMRTLLDWSFDLLSSREQACFARSAVFVGGFSLEAALGVCGSDGLTRDEILAAVSSLVDKSLIVAEFGQGVARYRLLESTREYALEKLLERGELESTRRSHVKKYVELAEQLECERYTTPDRAWVPRVRAELDNFRAALDWSLGTQLDAVAAQRLAAALLPVWFARDVAEGLRWTEAAFATTGDGSPSRAVARLCVALAQLKQSVGRHEDALRAAQRALRLSDLAADPLLHARALQNVGSALSFLGRAAEGERRLHEALEAARRLQNFRLVAFVLDALGNAQTRSGDLRGARESFSCALSECHAIGAERLAANVAINLAELDFASGDTTAALHTAEEALALHQALGNERATAICMCNIAAYLVRLERYDQAILWGLKALTALREFEAETVVLWALQHLAAAVVARTKDGCQRATEEAARATRLIGFVNARAAALHLTRDRTEEAEHRDAVAAASAILPYEDFELCLADGAAWTEARAVAEALQLQV